MLFKLKYVADILYPRIRTRGRWSRLRSLLLRRSPFLAALTDIQAAYTVNARAYVRNETVPIDQIRGSVEPTSAFDRNFIPLPDHSRDRWIAIAQARRQGQELPPVTLVQIGSNYFVQDGLYRISVACALGQKDLDARITVWDVSTVSGDPDAAPISRTAYRLVEA